MTELKVGQVWRDDLGQKFVIVAITEQLIYTMRAGFPKKQLRAAAERDGLGSYPTTRSDLEVATLVDEGPVF
jgi:hypothetical protein